MPLVDNKLWIHIIYSNSIDHFLVKSFAIPCKCDAYVVYVVTHISLIWNRIQLGFKPKNHRFTTGMSARFSKCPTAVVHLELCRKSFQWQLKWVLGMRFHVHNENWMCVRLLMRNNTGKNQIIIIVGGCMCACTVYT